MTAVTDAAALGGGGEALLQQPVEVLLRAVLILIERVHELRGEDLLRPRVHLLLAGREPLFHLADGEVADDLGELEHVTGLDLLPVVLEAPIPVFRHLRDVVREDVGDFFDFDLVDDPAKAGNARVLTRNHHREFVVEDLDREVVTLLPHQLPALFLQHDSCPWWGYTTLSPSSKSQTYGTSSSKPASMASSSSEIACSFRLC